MLDTPHFTPGYRPSAGKLNELSDLAARVLRSRPAGNGAVGSFGLLTADGLREGLWAKVTANDGGTPPAHAWVEMIESSSTVYEVKSDGMYGSTVNLPLYDINGECIPNGVITRIWRGQGEFMLTDAPSLLAWVQTTSTITPTTVNLGRIVTDGATTSGSTTLTSNSAYFAATTDLGATVTGAGIPSSTTISAVISSSSVTLSNPASASAAGVTVDIITGSISSYAAYVAIFSEVTGNWSLETAPVWLYFCNSGITPLANTRYQCRMMGLDINGAVIWGTVGSADQALAVLDKTGATVDGNVASIKADAAGMFTWVELTSSHVQVAIHPEDIFYNGGSVINFIGASTWNTGNYSWIIESTGIGGLTINGFSIGGVTINAPLEICGWQFWCCTTYTFTSAGQSNWTLPATATVFDLTAAGGGTLLDGIKPQAFGSAVNTGDLTGATNASPIVLTVPGWTTQPAVGMVVLVAGVNGNTAANGTWTVQASTPTTLTLRNTTGNGVFTTSVGSTVRLAGPQLIVLNNVSSSAITIEGPAGSVSDPGNQIILPPTYGTSVALAQNDSCTLWWDYCTSHQWRMISCTVDNDPVYLTSWGTGGVTNGLAYAQQYLSVNTALTAAMATIITITLPTAGTWLLTVDINVQSLGTTSAPFQYGPIDAQLYNLTGSSLSFDGTAKTGIITGPFVAFERTNVTGGGETDFTNTSKTFILTTTASVQVSLQMSTGGNVGNDYVLGASDKSETRITAVQIK